ncbi:hypothetical protein [Sorangium sp. So ce854]|uniref:hypothetical protein n=1 Tax=Sorangium sp. So ce854 TaxID=3133322 RepID=UPI003F63E0F8
MPLRWQLPLRMISIEVRAERISSFCARRAARDVYLMLLTGIYVKPIVHHNRAGKAEG